MKKMMFSLSVLIYLVWAAPLSAAESSVADDSSVSACFTPSEDDAGSIATAMEPENDEEGVASHTVEDVPEGAVAIPMPPAIPVAFNSEPPSALQKFGTWWRNATCHEKAQLAGILIPLLATTTSLIDTTYILYLLNDLFPSGSADCTISMCMDGLSVILRGVSLYSFTVRMQYPRGNFARRQSCSEMRTTVLAYLSGAFSYVPKSIARNAINLSTLTDASAISHHLTAEILASGVSMLLFAIEGMSQHCNCQRPSGV